MRSSVESYRRVSSWSIVAASLVAYAGLVAALAFFGVSLDLPLPPWAAQAIAPILYGTLATVVVRPRSARAIGGGAALLWALHLIIGALTAATLAALEGQAVTVAPILPPPLLPAALWVPVLLVPLKDWLRGRSPVAARRMP